MSVLLRQQMLPSGYSADPPATDLQVCGTSLQRHPISSICDAERIHYKCRTKSPTDLRVSLTCMLAESPGSYIALYVARIHLTTQGKDSLPPRFCSPPHSVDSIPAGTFRKGGRPAVAVAPPLTNCLCIISREWINWQLDRAVLTVTSVAEGLVHPLYILSHCCLDVDIWCRT